jgi:hypothetical protein
MHERNCDIKKKRESRIKLHLKDRKDGKCVLGKLFNCSVER